MAVGGLHVEDGDLGLGRLKEASSSNRRNAPYSATFLTSINHHKSFAFNKFAANFVIYQSLP